MNTFSDNEMSYAPAELTDNEGSPQLTTHDTE